MKKSLVVIMCLSAIFAGLLFVSGAGGKRERKPTRVEQQASEPSNGRVPHQVDVGQVETVPIHPVAESSDAEPESGQSDRGTALKALRDSLQAYLNIEKTASTEVRRQRWYEMLDFASAHPELILYLAEKDESVALRYLALICIEALCREGHKFEGIAGMLVRLIEDEALLRDSPFLVSSALEIARLTGATEILPAVNRLLGHSNIPAVVDSAALRFVREYGDETSIDPLLWRWENSQDMFALDAAASVGGEKLIKRLIRLVLYDPNGQKASASATWLQQVSGLEKHLETFKNAILFEGAAPADRIRLLISVAGAIQSPEVVDFLLPLAGLGKPYALQVIEALGKNHTQRAFDGLLKIINGTMDSDIRWAALSSIERLPVNLWSYDAVYSIYSSARDEWERLVAARVLCADRASLEKDRALRAEILSLAENSIRRYDNELFQEEGILLLCKLAPFDEEAARRVVGLRPDVDSHIFELAGDEIVETIATLARENTDAKQRFWDIICSANVKEEIRTKALQHVDMGNGEERRQLASLLNDSSPAEVVSDILTKLEYRILESSDEEATVWIRQFFEKTGRPELREKAGLVLKTIEMARKKFGE